jgi:hypothetical protein
MKFLKRIAIALLVVCVTWYFFGSHLFRWAVSYERVGEKRLYEVKDKKLIALIEREAGTAVGMSTRYSSAQKRSLPVT